MTKSLPWIGAALLALAVVARQETPVLPVERRQIWTDPEAIPEIQGHNDLQGALEQLSLDGAREVEFRRLAAGAIEDLRRAWELREAALGEGESQADYEEAKRKALEPLLSFLLGTAPDAFLAGFEEWIDSVR